MDTPLQAESATQVCSNCQSANPRDQRFCGNCGSPLTALPETVASIVARELDSRLKDQKVVAVEIAESVYDRVSKWAKIFVLLCTLPFGAAIYLIHGQYESLSDVIKSSRAEAEKILAGATAQAHSVEANVEAATTKTQGLNTLLENQGKSLTDLNAKISVAQRQLGGFDQRMQEYEAKVSKSGDEALGQVASLKQTGDTALSEIAKLREALARQQKELTETGTLLKELASRSNVEGFRIGQSAPGDFVTITRSPSSHLLAMRLKYVPYPETVRVQWNTAAQPLDSYFLAGNVVILPYWEDAITRLGERAIFVSYLADVNPPASSPFFKILTTENNTLLGDGKLIVPSLPPRPTK